MNDNIFFDHMVDLRPQPSRFPRRCHNQYELLLFVDGDADYVVENNKYTLRPFDLLVIKPAQYHFINLKSEKRYDRFVINFSENILPDSACGAPKAQYLHLDERDELTRMFYRLDGYAERYAESDRKLILSSVLIELLLSLSYTDRSAEAEAENLSPLLEKIIGYIGAHLTEDIDLDTISNALAISSSHLSHLFNKTFGISVMQYVRQKKILYAQNLMKSGVKPSQACLMCGFNNYATFYRAYKNCIGSVPSEKE